MGASVTTRGVVLTGGYPTTRTVELLLNRGWVALPDMKQPRTSHGCAVFNLGGREVVVVAGGQAGGEVLSSVEYLGVVGNENWASLPPLPLSRSSSNIPSMFSVNLCNCRHKNQFYLT